MTEANSDYFFGPCGIVLAAVTDEDDGHAVVWCAVTSEKPLCRGYGRRTEQGAMASAICALNVRQWRRAQTGGRMLMRIISIDRNISAAYTRTAARGKGIRSVPHRTQNR
jgi:hypothetical protein